MTRDSPAEGLVQCGIRTARLEAASIQPFSTRSPGTFWKWTRFRDSSSASRGRCPHQFLKVIRI